MLTREMQSLFRQFASLFQALGFSLLLYTLPSTLDVGGLCTKSSFCQEFSSYKCPCHLPSNLIWIGVQMPFNW